MIKIGQHSFSSKDDLIFSVLNDYKGIVEGIEYSTKPENLEILLNTCILYINNNQYSSINVTDEHGNTMLHYASLNNNLEIINHLIKNGANPYIENNNGLNCLNFKISHSDRNLLHFVIENIKIFQLEELKKENYSPEVCQLLFNINISKLPFIQNFLNINYQQIKETLYNYNILNNKNIIEILFNQYMIDNLSDKPNSMNTPINNMHNIVSLSEEELTPEESTLFHSKVLFAYNSITKKLKKDDIEYFNTHMFNFVRNATFVNNLNFVNSFYSLKKSNGKLNTFEVMKNDFLIKYTHLLSRNMIDCDFPIDKKCPDSFTAKTISNILFDNPEINAIYCYEYINKDLINNEANDKVKSKVVKI